MADTDILKNQVDFEEQFRSWFNAGYKGLIDDSRRRYRMVLEDANERIERGLSAVPSTKSAEVVDKAKESALVEYHKDTKSLSYTSKSIQNPESDSWAKWLTSVVHYRMNAVNGFPFFSWHDSSLKAGYTDSLECALVYWRKESYKESRKVYFDQINGQEISKEDYEALKETWPTEDPLVPPFETAYTEESVQEEFVASDTWWIDQLKPGENIMWDWKAPFMNVNLGQSCLVKIPKTVDEIMDYMDKGVFKKVKRDVIKQHQEAGDTDPESNDGSELIEGASNHDQGDNNRVNLWIYFEKVKFRWMVSFSIEGKVLLSDRKPVDDVFFNGRRVNVLPVVVGYMDKALHENIGRSLPQAIAPIEDQYTDHINNVNDIAKNMARGGRIRIAPGADVDIDQVLNGGVFTAESGEVEFVQYNSGVMDALRSADMHSAAINSLAPAGVSAVNIAPKGTNKTLGVSQMIQAGTDGKRYCQLMVRNQTFLKPLLWLIAQLEFSYETDDKALRIAASQVPGFQPPVVQLADGRTIVDTSKFDFDIDVEINAGLGEMPDTEKFNNLMQFKAFCDQIGITLDPMMLGQLGASLTGYDFGRFNPRPPQAPRPQPKLDSKLTVDAMWIDLPPQVQMMLIEKWKNGEVATDTKIDAQMKELMHNGNPQPAAQAAPDMTGGAMANAVSAGGQIGGMSG